MGRKKSPNINSRDASAEIPKVVKSKTDMTETDNEIIWLVIQWYSSTNVTNKRHGTWTQILTNSWILIQTEMKTGTIFINSWLTKLAHKSKMRLELVWILEMARIHASSVSIKGNQNCLQNPVNLSIMSKNWKIVWEQRFAIAQLVPSHFPSHLMHFCAKIDGIKDVMYIS